MRRPLTLLSNKALFMSLFWPAISPMGRKVNFSCLAKSACKTSVSVKEHVVKLLLPLRDPYRSGLSKYYLSFIWAADHSAAPINAPMCTPLTSQRLSSFANRTHCSTTPWCWGLNRDKALKLLHQHTVLVFFELLIGMIVHGYLSSSFSPVIK